LLQLGVTPALLSTDNLATSIRVQGGFVSVPWSGALNPPQFTLEALVEPEPGLVATQGRYFCVIESSDTPTTQGKRLGYALYAGPQDLADPNTPCRWQLWVGNGSNFVQVTEMMPYANNGTNPGPIVEAKPTYLAVTFDGTAFNLYVYTSGRNLDWVRYALNPAQYAQNTSGPGANLTIGITGPKRALVGTLPGPNHPLYPFSGLMEEVAVYNAGLSAARIMSHISVCFKDL
jgi:hypothetical protein